MGLTIGNLYDNFAKTFSKSRKNMKWEEINYFVEFLDKRYKSKKNWVIKILDVWCWNWRLIYSLQLLGFKFEYLWIDSSPEMIKEAQELFPDYNFKTLDMINIEEIWEQFDVVFLIASFHHLKDLASRLTVISKLKKVLKDSWVILMTNWNLLSKENMEKYSKSYLWDSDFEIKIWWFKRFYHWFDIYELSNIFANARIDIIENRVFDNWKNIISIVN